MSSNFFEKDALSGTEEKMTLFDLSKTQNSVMLGNVTCSVKPQRYIEFISPHNLFVQPNRTMYDLSYNPITVAHGGGENVLLSTEQAVEPFTILRIRL